MKLKVPAGIFQGKQNSITSLNWKKKESENYIFTFKEFNYHRHDLAYKRRTVQNQGCMLWYVTVAHSENERTVQSIKIISFA